ncbi:sensor histidine kinase KdpD [uncultured Muribaculum sp.]|uniref:sensor histidine kinase n=1 Tax=uncultured Muribaculum sp. TaxID=1918613 RepID=UPI00266F6F8E|nr:HAMP domain-containing sensor histidine kinase [uncultured Muribaculum sp.]
MNRFKTVSTIFVAVIGVIFLCNVYFLVKLYKSIRSDVEREVMTAMADADIDDMWERSERANRAAVAAQQAATAAGKDSKQFEERGGTVGNLDNEGNFVTETRDKEGNIVVEKNKLRRDRSYSNQMVADMSRQMHFGMDPWVDFDLAIMDSILNARLSDRRIYPDFLAVEIVDSKGNILRENPRISGGVAGYDVFTLCFSPEKDMHYRAYMTPLTRHILSEMTGVIITVFLLMAAFVLAFIYLFCTVSKLRTLEEMKDDFINNMTHELKTPIAIAYSANDALLNFDTSNNPAKKETYLRIANHQIKRLGELVENILAMSMERRKTMMLNQEIILLEPLIEDIVAAQRTRCEKKISICVQAHKRGCYVKADKNHFSNVLNNLIDNAIKYSGESVNIEIIVSKDSITVKDNGIGIPAKSVPFIFNKFYRVQHGNCLEVRGYGIGLYYVREILEKMDMTITVTSRVGEGSVFTIGFNGYEE